ncbi:hybrid sensor histidine kinase/response regulator transcription factor [Phaeodactylibacter xiamenensis]|uniref:hybrid sensor histidine kinase/response regulator transcription factor n=1 Tax=Phaeodactylibacter xiamenensis TaxID=1524460 RepID=UPI003BA9E9CB
MMIRDLPVLLYTAICLAAMAGLSNKASAQLGGPRFINYGVGEGLSQSTVLSAHQDNYGFLWLGTRDGLNRFDGYAFEVFRRQPADSTSLANNVINDITGDSLGNIWIATQGGVSRYLINQSGFLNYTFHNLAQQETRCLWIDPHHQLWAGTNDGLFRYNPATDAFEQPDNPLAKAVGERYVTKIFTDRQDRLWVGTTSGLFCQLPDQQTIITYTPNAQRPAHQISNERVEDIIQAADGTLWVATYGGGVCAYDQNGQLTAHYDDSPDSEVRLSNAFVRCLEATPDQNLWIGTFQGLNILDTRTLSLQKILQDSRSSNGLSHGSVRALLQDRKGAIWVGTYFGGVDYFDPDNQRFQHYTHLPELDHSLSFNVVSAFAEASNGQYYVATERGGLNLFDPQTRRFRRLRGQSGHELRSMTIKSLYAAPDGQLWVGTFKGGLHAYNPKTNRFTPHFGAETSQLPALSDAIVNAIAPAGAYLWIGTDKHGGLHKFDPQSGQYVDYPMREALHQHLLNVNVKAIYADQLGNLWLSTFGRGLVLFNEQTGRITTFEHLPENSNSLPRNDVTHVLEDQQGQIWVATKGGGISRFDRQRQQFQNYDTRHGLQNNTVLGLLEDQQGQIWVSTINGISRWENKNQRFRNYSYTNGFPLEELNEGAFFTATNGQLFFGGSNGFVTFDPASLADNSYVPPVYLTALKLFNKDVTPGDDTRLLNASMLQTDELQLRYFQSIITLEFTALNFLRPEQNRYQYKLEGLEDNWNEVGNQRSATYTNLKEGTYTFLLKGANNDGLWNPEPAQLKITVEAPPWRTWWAILLYSLVILLGIYLLRYLSLRSARLRNEIRIKELEKEKLEEVHQLKLQSFTDVSHEFRTPLTLIIDPLEQVLEQHKAEDWLGRQLHLMHFNARRLLLLVNQVLDINALETGKVGLRKEPVPLGQMTKHICDTFRGQAAKHQLELYFADELPEAWYEADKDKLEKIIYNLISNAIKFNKPGGQVRVALSQKPDNGKVQLTVADTGQGIAPEVREKVFERFYKSEQTKGTGIGLSLTKSLVEAMGGSIRLQSQPDSGTTFTLLLPLKPVGQSDENAASAFVKPLPVEYQLSVDEPNAAPENTNSSSKLHLLIVEDDPDLRRYLRDNLSGAYKITTAKNGRSGLEKARTHTPDFILSDIMMPEMDGIEMCRALKTDPEYCHIPILLLTAKGEDTDRVHALETGADDYLAKPFIMRELRSRIQNRLKMRDLLRRRYSHGPDLQTEALQLNSYDEELLQRVQAAVEAHLDDPDWSVEALAEAVNLSRVHLYRKLKGLLDVSPSTFIRNIRLKHAAQLLAQNKVNVSEVAYRVGFQDPAYFGKSFKKQYGLSPSQYAKQAGK